MRTDAAAPARASLVRIADPITEVAAQARAFEADAGGTGPGRVALAIGVAA